MGLDGVLADEEAIGDLAVAETLGDEGEDFELARGDAEGVELGLVEGEGFGGDSFDDDRLAGFGELDAEPDAEAGEEDGDECAVDLEGVLDDEELVLGPAPTRPRIRTWLRAWRFIGRFIGCWVILRGGLFAGLVRVPNLGILS